MRRGLILLVGHPADWVLARFGNYAREHGLETWQPASFADLAWAFEIDGDERSLVLADRRNGRRARSSELAGIWIQSLPPLGLDDALDPSDRSYATAELSNASWALWSEPGCTVLGHPSPVAPPHVFDFGIEARVGLRQAGIPVAGDVVGTLESVVTRAGDALHRLRLTRLGQYTTLWLFDAIAGAQGKPSPPLQSGEMLAATGVDDDTVGLALCVGGEIACFSVLEHERGVTVEQVDAAPELVSIARAVVELTAAQLVLVYTGREAGECVVLRVSLHLPFWLLDACSDWLFPRVAAVLHGPRVAVA